jgi:hypothetical protein
VALATKRKRERKNTLSGKKRGTAEKQKRHCTGHYIEGHGVESLLMTTERNAILEQKPGGRKERKGAKAICRGTITTIALITITLITITTTTIPPASPPPPSSSPSGYHRRHHHHTHHHQRVPTTKTTTIVIITTMLLPLP